ncbi:MAG: ferritin family protein [Desulfomonile tiedjei]|uniref:Ferritin family protein n=1 Tax=Desulfomonile tiedjei TaxID=2358 RepID=A0A9D6V1K1_9BACT|nr:ferritin family protein [Desulfomonile tiedjei]
MQQWKSVDEILDFAIGQEEEAAKFYTELSGRMDRPWMSKIFQDFAKEEMGHKKKLQDIKAGKLLLSAEKKVLDLKIGDYLVDVEPTSEHLDYQQALVIAMKKEKKAFKMYSDLADATDDANIRAAFLSLAQEEAKHKLRFEIEYDDVIMSEN